MGKSGANTPPFFSLMCSTLLTCRRPLPSCPVQLPQPLQWLTTLSRQLPFGQWPTTLTVLGLIPIEQRWPAPVWQHLICLLTTIPRRYRLTMPTLTSRNASPNTLWHPLKRLLIGALNSSCSCLIDSECPGAVIVCTPNS